MTHMLTAIIKNHVKHPNHAQTKMHSLPTCCKKHGTGWWYQQRLLLIIHCHLKKDKCHKTKCKVPKCTANTETQTTEEPLPIIIPTQDACTQIDNPCTQPIDLLPLWNDLTPSKPEKPEPLTSSNLVLETQIIEIASAEEVVKRDSPFVPVLINSLNLGVLTRSFDIAAKRVETRIRAHLKAYMG